MSKIRLLTSIQGDGPVAGDVGEILDVDPATARIWADDVRAVLIDGQPVTGRRVRRAVDHDS